MFVLGPIKNSGQMKQFKKVTDREIKEMNKGRRAKKGGGGRETSALLNIHQLVQS